MIIRLIIRTTFEGAPKRLSMSLGGGSITLEDLEKEADLQEDHKKSKQTLTRGFGPSRQPRSTAPPPHQGFIFTPSRISSSH